MKYSLENLKILFTQHSVELIGDYSNIVVSRKTKIQGICTTNGCSGQFNKSYRELNEKLSFYCKSCQLKIKTAKTKATMIKKYGADSPMKCIQIRDKIYKTNLEKYGHMHSFQSNFVKEKIQQTNLKKYGVSNPAKSKIVRDNYKKTCLKKYGVKHISMTEMYKEKFKSTMLKIYNVINPSQIDNVKKKKINTCLENYGVSYPSQNISIKNKIKETNLKNFGYEHPSQNPEELDKRIKRSYRIKEFIMPSGKSIYIQGDEAYALTELLEIENINEDDIVTGSTNVPELWYNDLSGKKHRHYVDIFIPTQNRCIEVKSVWTAKLHHDDIFLKQHSAKQLGYNYEIWVYNSKKQKVQTHT